MSDSPWLTPELTAKRVHKSIGYVRKAMRDGTLRSTLVGRHRLTHVTWIDQWLGLDTSNHDHNRAEAPP